MRLGGESIDDHSALFSSRFCEGAVEAVKMADQGSDGNIIPPRVFAHLLKAMPDLEVTKLDKQVSFGTADENAPPLPFDSKLTLDVCLRIRHGTQLSPRHIDWYVSTRNMEYVIIGRHGLAALGLDNKKLLAAACDRNDGIIDVPEILAKYDNKQEHDTVGSIHDLLVFTPDGSTFHSLGGDEHDGLEDSELYVDLRDDPEEALDSTLAEAVE